ncbi:Ead/Ea22-like family protein [Escherichia coli]|nr:Ead/Ea22-like family protein [Escherichia coli]
MREKIKNPVVVLYKRETSDSYAVSITDGSQNMHDGLLMASVSPDDSDYPFATFAMVGYYMAAEIEKLRVELETVKQREKDLFMENVRLKSGIAGLIHLGIRYADVEVMKIAGDAQLSTPYTDSIINSIASGVFTKEGQHDENSRSSR